MISTFVCRLLRAACVDPVTGVNAQLVGMPKLAPQDPAPEPLAAVLSPDQDDAAVTAQGIPDWPVGVVTCEQPAQAKTTSLRGFQVDVPSLVASFAYVTLGTAEPAAAWAAADVVLLAAMRAIEAGVFASDRAAVRAPAAGPVQVVQLNGLTFGAVNAPIQGGVIRGALLLDLRLRVALPPLPA